MGKRLWRRILGDVHPVEGERRWQGGGVAERADLAGSRTVQFDGELGVLVLNPKGGAVGRESETLQLKHGLGVFIEGRYLAGIGAVLPHPSENAGEIASLFALTRYVGEGVGSQIVRFAMERAREQGLAYLFSCTTSARVEEFFLRHGFRRVSPDDVPKAKWQDYDPDRLSRVRCLRFDPAQES